MRMIALTAAAVALVGLASPSFASGSSGSSRGGGGFSGSVQTQQDRQIQRLLRQGRSQVRKHITCKGCEFHRRLNKDTAREVAENVAKGQYNIAEEDRTAVLFYLRDRYRL
ncbi:hypothetical protein [uncultured Erythrobacter sp.]|uniref:hypothetical protein n=1 Tax=uncultured Erythrobacter sp. TaxID=263913 RepID=UPI00262140C5|nr:hypothetical protein [uncultured Erythrobacter sp.]